MYTQGLYRDRHTKPVMKTDTISELKILSEILKFWISKIIKSLYVPVHTKPVSVQMLMKPVYITDVLTDYTRVEPKQ